MHIQEEREPWGFLQGNLLASLAMLSEPETPATGPPLSRIVRERIAGRYREAEAERYGIDADGFTAILAAVVERYATDDGEDQQLQLIATLRVGELVLARACSAGNGLAWDEFLTRFRAPLYEAAYRIAKNEATGRELADGLYAELFGMTNAKGERASKLDYYMGRGSLEGWLRTVLAQQYVNRYRAQRKEVSLEEQVEAGKSFAARPAGITIPSDTRAADAVKASFAELKPEERFLLASYYLDERTLADIGRQLHVHESTVSRKLERLTQGLHKRVRKRLQAMGMNARRADEVMQELDVRDLDINVGANLRQETPLNTFLKKG